MSVVYRSKQKLFLKVSTFTPCIYFMLLLLFWVLVYDKFNIILDILYMYTYNITFSVLNKDIRILFCYQSFPTLICSSGFSSSILMGSPNCFFSVFCSRSYFMLINQSIYYHSSQSKRVRDNQLRAMIRHLLLLLHASI